MLQLNFFKNYVLVILTVVDTRYESELATILG